jgi:hypothetical protein
MRPLFCLVVKLGVLIVLNIPSCEHRLLICPQMGRVGSVAGRLFFEWPLHGVDAVQAANAGQNEVGVPGNLFRH